MPPPSALLRLTNDLDRWGALFLQVAKTKEVFIAEQVLGGLVEWMGSDLLDGWLHLPIPLFEELSALSEELFLACQVYFAWLRETTTPTSVEGRQAYEDSIRAVLGRVDALAQRRGEGGDTGTDHA
jgi:hypothetical protein